LNGPLRLPYSALFRLFPAITPYPLERKSADN